MKKYFVMFTVAVMVLSSSILTFATDLPEVTEPVTIEIWHTRGAGANGDQLAEAIEEFEKENELITIEEVYQGGYSSTLSKTSQAIVAGNNPVLVVLERAAGVPVLAEKDVLMDMFPFAERDNLDLDNIVDVFDEYCYYNGELISLPYARSTPVFYYNKDMFVEEGLVDGPETIDELVEVAKDLTVRNNDGSIDVYGFCLLNDPAWYIQNMLYQLGSNLYSEDGKDVPCLKDGTMLKVLSAWRDWVDDGWCAPPNVTRGESSMKEMFNQGKIASYLASSGGLTNNIKNGEAAGVKVGVSQFPTWDKPAAPVGGGNIAIIERNNSDLELAAAWEFVKFCMSDWHVAHNAVKTGYLPVTYSAVETDRIQEQWEKDPRYKVAWDQLEIAQELPWSSHKSEFEHEVLRPLCSKLIIDRSISAEAAVKQMKEEAALIFPDFE